MLAGIGLSDQVPTLFWFLAGLTMTVGNILALLQDNLKRLMAYSSIAHAGYMLVAVATDSYLSADGSATSGVAALLFYLIAYGTMTLRLLRRHADAAPPGACRRNRGRCWPAWRKAINRGLPSW